jgi:hypothetical protein
MFDLTIFFVLLILRRADDQTSFKRLKLSLLLSTTEDPSCKAARVFLKSPLVSVKSTGIRIVSLSVNIVDNTALFLS